MKLWRKMAWLAAMSGLGMVVLLVGSTAKSQGQATNLNQVTIIGTSSLRGEVSPCG